MQKIYFKKQVDLNHQLKELVSISVDESIQYKIETRGMRAVGSIMMNGEYKDEISKKDFSESIDLDILAVFDKITDKRDFQVKVEDFDYTLNDGNLDLVIQASIYGVLDDEDRIVETPKSEYESQGEVIERIEDILQEQDQAIEQELVETPIQKRIETPVSSLEQQEDLGIYYLYIVQDGDTYQSIGQRYKIDEYKLKEYNRDRTLLKGTIVIVPYVI